MAVRLSLSKGWSATVSTWRSAWPLITSPWLVPRWWDQTGHGSLPLPLHRSRSPYPPAQQLKKNHCSQTMAFKYFYVKNFLLFSYSVELTYNTRKCSLNPDIVIYLWNIKQYIPDEDDVINKLMIQFSPQNPWHYNLQVK